MLAIVVEVIDDETTSRRHDDGDHGVMPVTKMIWSPEDGDQKEQMILAISCHYLIACDVYHVLHLICLERR